ncbi:hypothetical protein K438DRAFT_2078649 [Mycena galopus ATCC 62051]|nr:hypothetical protein K438DRAFT_2078649 [Mycena galopus ATCC 62051]
MRKYMRRRDLVGVLLRLSLLGASRGYLGTLTWSLRRGRALSVSLLYPPWASRVSLASALVSSFAEAWEREQERGRKERAWEAWEECWGEEEEGGVGVSAAARRVDHNDVSSLPVHETAILKRRSILLVSAIGLGVFLLYVLGFHFTASGRWGLGLRSFFLPRLGRRVSIGLRGASIYLPVPPFLVAVVGLRLVETPLRLFHFLRLTAWFAFFPSCISSHRNAVSMLTSSSHSGSGSSPPHTHAHTSALVSGSNTPNVSAFSVSNAYVTSSPASASPASLPALSHAAPPRTRTRAPTSTLRRPLRGQHDDSADSNFFELSTVRGRRGRCSTSYSSSKHGAGRGRCPGPPRARAWGRGWGEMHGGRGTSGATASADVSAAGGGGAGAGQMARVRARRWPVLSVRVPVRAGQGMRLPAELPVCDAASSSASAPRRARERGRERGGNLGSGSVSAAMLNREGRVQRLRRGLNDELNCNACGLYCKLHKRPWPETMRNASGGAERHWQSIHAEAVDVMVQCYSCHTTATPLWHKDNEGKTYMLHGSAPPISFNLKSAIIRKRSRHDARRGGMLPPPSPRGPPPALHLAAPNGTASSASTSASRASPTLAPDSTTTTHTYATPSELSSALAPKPPYGHPYLYHE